ncbi:auxin-responsive protein IAA8-like [Prosopis cineraria]|uniref:auxin-responsive protein IAA8-like n=1 Tax=Prosopis cineraria TaxID=364024 RepID=UPI00241015ED|nr:auxin-responsive protein IAA8-like [Prosopis cineraria]XP_054789194.1 auxin-responsive protein IAA8-like [Prosopis cineraria]
MSTPLLGRGEDKGQSNVNLLASSTTMESVCLISSKLKERDYMGLSDCSSVDSSDQSFSNESKTRLNLKATELRLGLPGSQSPEREDSDNRCFESSTQFDEKPLFPLHPSTDDQHRSSKNAILGNKRGFSEAMNEFSKGNFLANSEGNTILSPRTSPNLGLKTSYMLDKAKEAAPTKVEPESPHVVNETRPNHNGSANKNNGAPATKAQVVGWPPIRSQRKILLATTAKNAEEVDGKALFIKVSMDGAPYLRKVDLKNYSAYPELSSSLEKMFSCFTIGQCGSNGTLGSGMLNESKMRDLLRGSEFVLTYEDREGDWMLVGDVPWEMFVETCRRMRIMKSSEAIGLAPRKK